MTARWWERGACYGKDQRMWFDRDRQWMGKEYCEDCPVRRQCLDDAERREETYGLWGGKVFDRWHTMGNPDRGPRPTEIKCETCGTTTPVKGMGTVRRFCDECSRQRVLAQRKAFNARQSGQPLVACRECGVMCVGENGLVTHMGIMHGVPGMAHYRYPSTGEPA